MKFAPEGVGDVGAERRSPSLAVKLFGSRSRTSAQILDRVAGREPGQSAFMGIRNRTASPSRGSGQTPDPGARPREVVG